MTMARFSIKPLDEPAKSESRVRTSAETQNTPETCPANGSLIIIMLDETHVETVDFSSKGHAIEPIAPTCNLG